MFRSLAIAALSLFLLTEANAQTTPAAKKTTAKKTAAATARAQKKAARADKKVQRLAQKSTPKTLSTDDGWPPLTQEELMASNTAADSRTPDAVSASLRDEVAYAAPGMAVHVNSGSGLVPYSVRPPRKAAQGTTLSPVAANQ